MNTKKYLVDKKIALEDYATSCGEDLKRDDVEKKLMPENLKESMVF